MKRLRDATAEQLAELGFSSQRTGAAIFSEESYNLCLDIELGDMSTRLFLPVWQPTLALGYLLDVPLEDLVAQSPSFLLPEDCRLPEGLGKNARKKHCPMSLRLYSTSEGQQLVFSAYSSAFRRFVRGILEALVPLAPHVQARLLLKLILRASRGSAFESLSLLYSFSRAFPSWPGQRWSRADQRQMFRLLCAFLIKNGHVSPDVLRTWAYQISYDRRSDPEMAPWTERDRATIVLQRSVREFLYRPGMPGYLRAMSGFRDPSAQKAFVQRRKRLAKLAYRLTDEQLCAVERTLAL